MRRVAVCALALLGVATVAPLAKAATLEVYQNSFAGVSESARCSTHSHPDSAYAGYVAGKCVRDFNGDSRPYNSNTNSYTIVLAYQKLTCTVGGSVLLQSFQTADCSGTASTVFSGTDKTCSGSYQGSTSDYAYVDCAASALPSSITGDSYQMTQSFTDSSCSTPSDDTSGLQSYSYVNATGGCVSDGGSSSSPRTYYSNDVYKTADGKGYLYIRATDPQCAEWYEISYAPLGGCTATQIGSSSYGTNKVVYTRATLDYPATTTSPVAWPPAGNHLATVQCTNDACSSECSTVGYIRLGQCRDRSNTGNAYKSARRGVSADGLYSIITYYADSACTPAQRQYASATPIGRTANCGKNDDRSYYAAVAPSGASDVALAQLPLPSLGVASYYSSGSSSSAVACNSTYLGSYQFREPGVCFNAYDGSNAQMFTVSSSSGAVTLARYTGTTCSGSSSSSSPAAAATCDVTYSTATSYFPRTVAAVQAGAVGKLAGWYSTDATQTDAGAAYSDAAEGVTPGKSSDGDVPNPNGFNGAAHAAAQVSMLAVMGMAAVAALFAQ